ncbi:MAG: sigma-54-dependent Fis family transcriptional regulator [Alphaproteobacteria bacterium]|nr:sigma-54-dependent Fis family transcriptional regulator [Alphaproteobacteria bacterium]
MAHDILIVDDEADIRNLVNGILEDEGYTCRAAGDSGAALEEIAARKPNLLILDVWLQGSQLDGLGLLDVIQREHPDLPVVIISGHGSIETAVAAIKRGAYDFIEKPFQADRLLLVIDRAIEAASLKRQNMELLARSSIGLDLVGASQVMTQVRAAIARVAPTGSRVLITGPAGSGKEVVARMIHAHSRRTKGPFVVINAATMAPERMEAELFGQEPGAQGQGSLRKVGTFEQAHGGTLFLDQVADMPLETQGKILRVLQDQTFQRVGGGPQVNVDVRVIAASSRDLAAEIAAGTFREDLFYRLSVVPLRLPALRERREDVPELATYFMARAAETAGLAPREIGADALAALQACDWPGNVRQLRNVIDWLLIMATGDPRAPIVADMLPPELGVRAPVTVGADSGGQVMALPLREAREMFERQYLEAQLTRFGGNISRTAAFIGMERSALHRKLKSLGVADDSRAPVGRE